MTSHCGSLWRKCLLILLVLLQIQTLASAQFDSLRMRRDVFRFADGVIHTLSSPVRWNGKDLATLGALAAGTTALTFVDQPVRHFFQSRDNRFLDGVERIGYHYGKPYMAVGLSAGFYLSGMIFRSEWAKETGMMLGASIFSSSLVMGALKNGAGRARSYSL